MSLDHGVLNIPGRTGTINRDLDRHNARQAREAKAAAKAATAKRKADKAEAQRLFALHGDALCEWYAARHRFKPAAVRKHLEGWIKWTPADVVSLVAKFQSEREVAA